MKKIILTLVVAALAVVCLAGETAALDGTWQMVVSSMHGKMHGPLKIQQEGSKLTGSFDIEGHGKLDMNGEVDGHKIVLKLVMPGGPAFEISGTVDGKKMSGTGAQGEPWSASKE